MKPFKNNIFVFLCLLWIGFTCILFYVLFPGQNIAKEYIYPLSLNILSSFLLLAIGINKISEKISKSVEGEYVRRNLGKVYDFWNIPSKNREWYVLFGGSKNDKIMPNDPDYDPDKASPRPTVATVYAYSEIAKIIRIVLEKQSANVHFKNIKLLSENDWLNLQKSNVIFLGGILSIPGIIKHIMDKSEIGIEQKIEGNQRSFWIENDNLSRVKEMLTTRLKGKIVENDYACVMRVVSENNSIFIFNGGYGVGTLAAVKVFSSEAFSHQLKEIPKITNSNCIGGIVKVTDVDAENPNVDETLKCSCDTWAKSNLNIDKIYKEMLDAYHGMRIQRSGDK